MLTTDIAGRARFAIELEGVHHGRGTTHWQQGPRFGQLHSVGGLGDDGEFALVIIACVHLVTFQDVDGKAGQTNSQKGARQNQRNCPKVDACKWFKSN